MRIIKPRYNKYHNKPTIINGIRFASKREASRFIELKIMEIAGAISNLRLQPVYKFPMGFSYRADFEYIETGNLIAEDVKGVETDVFKLKKKCMEYFYRGNMGMVELRVLK